MQFYALFFLLVWRNRQTQGTYNPSVEISYRFDPDYQHQKDFAICKVFFVFMPYAHNALPENISRECSKMCTRSIVNAILSHNNIDITQSICYNFGSKKLSANPNSGILSANTFLLKLATLFNRNKSIGEI